jgi:hypothetical protein
MATFERTNATAAAAISGRRPSTNLPSRGEDAQDVAARAGPVTAAK